MERWIAYAIAAMFFAGFTSVIAKLGLSNISGDLGLSIRTIFVFVMVFIFATITVPISDLQHVTAKNVFWLGLSGLTTTVSCIFYYKAIKLGDVSTVALIDKGSVVVALLLSWWVLHESLSTNKLVGCALILAGLVVIARN